MRAFNCAAYGLLYLPRYLGHGRLASTRVYVVTVISTNTTTWAGATDLDRQSHLEHRYYLFHPSPGFQYPPAMTLHHHTRILEFPSPHSHLHSTCGPRAGNRIDIRCHSSQGISLLLGFPHY